VVPEIALVEAAKILRKHLNPIITYREPGPETFPDSGLRNMLESTGYAPVDLELEERLSRSLAELNLSVRATNCLESEGINTVRDLVIRTDDQLLQVRNFGDTTLQEVRERLATIGLRLGMRLPQSMQQRDRKRSETPFDTVLNRSCDIERAAESWGGIRVIVFRCFETWRRV
jgi:DNA-directed RNA polymerase subunit alpha